MDAFQNKNKKSNGFTLIEMVVSIGLFTIVLFIASSAFLTIVNSDRKARSIRVATDNLNLTLEDMSRRIKTGSKYYCGTTDSGGVGDCVGGSSSMFFNGQDGTRVGYSLSAGGISRTFNGAPALPVTSPEINITNLKFIVKGSTVGDAFQPSVLVSVAGVLSGGPNATSTTFNLQTLVTQRAYDI